MLPKKKVKYNSQTLKMISQVETFLCLDKQETPEEGWRIQQPKHCEKNNKDEDNSPKMLTDKKKQQAESWKIQIY